MAWLGSDHKRNLSAADSPGPTLAPPARAVSVIVEHFMPVLCYTFSVQITQLIHLFPRFIHHATLYYERLYGVTR